MSGTRHDGADPAPRGAAGSFPLLLLLGRPASGKSEIIDYITRLDSEERLRRFRIGTPVILDDFPLLWAWFEEDAILERMGKPRLHTTAEGLFSEKHFWNVLVRRLCLEYDKLLASEPVSDRARTVIMEFSRGSEHGGYRESFQHLSEAVVRSAAVVYVRVSFEESLRKNRRRFNPDRPHSILEHGLSDETLDRLYRHDDWAAVTGGGQGSPATASIAVAGREMPAVTFENEDDVTTPRGAPLGARLEECLHALWLTRR